MRHWQTVVLALGLAALGLGVMAYKASALDLPLRPGEAASVWTLESRIAVRSEQGGPVRIDQPVPSRFDDLDVIAEDFISSSFDTAIEGEGGQRRAIWTARRMRGAQTLYHRLQLAPDADTADARPGERPPPPPVPDYDEPFATAVEGLLAEVRESSAGVESFARLLIRRYRGDGDRAELLRSRARDAASHARNLVHILAGARIPARVSWTLPLRDGIRGGELAPWLEVYDAEGWFAIDPDTGDVGLPDGRLFWLQGRSPEIKADGGAVVRQSFAVSQTDRELMAIARERDETGAATLLGLTLFDLPVETQQVLQLILVVPVGALVVVAMRNIVGVATFGTFMPVLMALAFRETRLLLGVALLVAIVAVALAVRFYLERLHLLLVPRLGVVLTVVVLIMLGIALGSHRLGLDQALSVALFPMVILAMVVERMSVVWDEAGPGDAMRQGLGSLAVAAVAYVLMNQELVRHLVFVFPESLLLVMAAMLALGRYTGYRLSELWRFRDALRGGPRWR